MEKTNTEVLMRGGHRIVVPGDPAQVAAQIDEVREARRQRSIQPGLHKLGIGDADCETFIEVADVVAVLPLQRLRS